MIGRTRPRVCRMTPQAAEWTITSPKMNAAAQMKMKDAAVNKRMQMTSTRTKYSRDRPTAETRRPAI